MNTDKDIHISVIFTEGSIASSLWVASLGINTSIQFLLLKK